MNEEEMLARIKELEEQNAELQADREAKTELYEEIKKQNEEISSQLADIRKENTKMVLKLEGKKETDEYLFKGFDKYNR